MLAGAIFNTHAYTHSANNIQTNLSGGLVNNVNLPPHLFFNRGQDGSVSVNLVNDNSTNANSNSKSVDSTANVKNSVDVVIKPTNVEVCRDAPADVGQVAFGDNVERIIPNVAPVAISNANPVSNADRGNVPFTIDPQDLLKKPGPSKC